MKCSNSKRGRKRKTGVKIRSGAILPKKMGTIVEDLVAPALRPVLKKNTSTVRLLLKGSECSEEKTERTMK